MRLRRRTSPPNSCSSAFSIISRFRDVIARANRGWRTRTHSVRWDWRREPVPFRRKPRAAMCQVLFRIPIPIPGVFPGGIPIYGFGLMLFLAFVICLWLAGRRAMKVGVPKELVQDLAIWVIVGGVIGARATFLLVEETVDSPVNFFKTFLLIWKGGLVWYGSLIAGVPTFCAVYYFYVRKHGIGFWKLADIYAPCIA